MDPTAHLLLRDVDDTRALLELAATAAPEDLGRPLLPRHVVLDWDGPEESIGAVLDHLVWTKQVWLAALSGSDVPSRGAGDFGALRARHEAVAGAWLDVVERIAVERRWGDVVIDALCDPPPESFPPAGGSCVRPRRADRCPRQR